MKQSGAILVGKPGARAARGLGPRAGFQGLWGPPVAWAKPPVFRRSEKSGRQAKGLETAETAAAEVGALLPRF